MTSCFFPFPFYHPFLFAAAKSLQSCPTLREPIDGSPPGSPVPGILQARTLEWAAISFSNAWKWKVKVKSVSRVRLCVKPWTEAHQAPPSMGFSRQEYWSGVPWPSPPFLFIFCHKNANLYQVLCKLSIPFSPAPEGASPWHRRLALPLCLHKLWVQMAARGCLVPPSGLAHTGSSLLPTAKPCFLTVSRSNHKASLTAVTG